MNDDAVLDGLRKVADDRVRVAGPDDAIDGVQPRYVATPASTEETSELLRIAAHSGLRLVAKGSGSKQDWGNPPSELDLVLDTAAMTGVVEHAAGDLITVVRAGTTMADLQQELSRADQFLALDAPIASATVGGTVATNTSGPRRVLYGTLRDLLIGITFVRADGVVAKAGGKVVKNVAGYDFGKLLTGSFGTLGVVTEVALRLHPLPKETRVLTVTLDDAEEAATSARNALRSQAVPSAVELDQPAGGPVSVSVLLEGVEAGVEARAGDIRRILGESSEVGAVPDWFGAYPFDAGDVGLKITSTITGVGEILAGARALGDKYGVLLSVRGSAAGVLYAGMPAATDPSTVAHLLGELRALAASYAGSVVVLTGPTATRSALDVWGPVPGLDLMRRLKEQLDPDHRLAPGRFVGGI